jgi:hypothetical protein
MLHKDYDHKGSDERKISGRESQGAWHQDGLIGSKPPVVRNFDFDLTESWVDLDAWLWREDVAYDL